MSYSLTVICIQEFANMFRHELPKLSYAYTLSISDYDMAYDWLVREAFKRLYPRNYIQDHYRHDVYRCIYDEVGASLQHVLRNKFRLHHISFNDNERIKVLVAGDNIILARGTLFS